MFESQTHRAPGTNARAARTVFAVAALLEAQGANPYRVNAYRRAAVNMLRLPDAAVHYTNQRGELALPSLGDRLRRKLGELVLFGRMQFQDDLLADLPKPLRELLSIPGVGPKTAERFLRELQVASVEEVAVAARAGRLQTMVGIGKLRERRIGEAAEQVLRERAGTASQLPVAA